ncbi:Uncharacterized protein TCM_004066 [Theobroma cacao]|uniref:Uncharacterized protein n=1 Tax=Theobroma cacao TaxID=3641 RepID=A0A061DQU1_THECC|nr:Uncharacterized protein TCM_004066 [Theobroma cacao]
MTRTKQENLEALLRVPKNKWGFNVGINIYCNTKARFSKHQFYLVTRLKFSPMLDVISHPYEALKAISAIRSYFGSCRQSEDAYPRTLRWSSLRSIMAFGGLNDFQDGSIGQHDGERNEDGGTHGVNGDEPGGID